MLISTYYQAADLGLEGSLLAGILGGYVTGLLSGVLISLPGMFFIGGQHLTMPLLAGVGVLGGLLRDLAPDPEEIWRFSPFFDLNIYRFFKESKNYRRTAFHLLFLAGILVGGVSAPDAGVVHRAGAVSPASRAGRAAPARPAAPSTPPRCSPSPFR